jgi:HSP20 family molecular chaperone IbpA
MSTQLETQKAKEAPAPASTSAQNWKRPYYDVSENEDAFSVQVRLPGVNREGIDISLDDDTLTIIGTSAQHVPSDWRPLRREIAQSDYRLSLRLNVPVNEDKIQASVADGILDLSLPKADEVKPRKIQIS